MIRFAMNTNHAQLGSKFVLMDENINPNLFSNATSGAVLLPPPSLLLKYCDDLEKEEFYKEYHIYLYNYARDFIASMVYNAMYCDQNIVIVLDENQSLYFRPLMSFMHMRYGLEYIFEEDVTHMKHSNALQLSNLRYDLISLGLADPYECTQKIYPNVVNLF